MSDDDDLRHADRQMVEHWLTAMREVRTRVLDVCGLDSATPEGAINETQWRLGLTRLMREDPEFPALMERVADYFEFRDLGSPG